MSTTQTPNGAVTTVTMAIASGLATPSQVNLADGSVVFPNASGQIVVSSEHIPPLMRAGWQLVVGSGTTHIP